MGLLTKKRLSDAERQSWSAQLIEVAEAERKEWGEEPTLGETWTEHDQQYSWLYWTEYYPKFGVLAGVEMAADGHHPAGYRQFFTEGVSMLILADEIQNISELGWNPGEIYWCSQGENPEEWGWQRVAVSWSDAKDYMKDRVRDWDLENERKNDGLWKKRWNTAFLAVGLAIAAYLTIFILLPLANVLVVFLAEVLPGVAALGGAGLLGLGGRAVVAGIGDGSLFQGITDVGNVLGDFTGLGRDDFYDTLAGSNLDPKDPVLVAVREGKIPIFQSNGSVLASDNAPPDSPTSSGESGLLLAALALLLLL